MIVAGERPGACFPNIAESASEKYPVEIPFEYNQGISVSMLFIFLKYVGTIKR